MNLSKSDSLQNQNGNLTFFGTDIAVSILFNYLKAGRNLEDFLEDYPNVKISQVNEALELAEEQLNLVFKA
ncbi:MAG: DUF433 domain-containing protein [Sphingobacteriaceae bacterium]|nr:MAG: DUF433 domain-containing protein [Sphingobacteriaceae bacterium]